MDAWAKNPDNSIWESFTSVYLMQIWWQCWKTETLPLPIIVIFCDFGLTKYFSYTYVLRFHTKDCHNIMDWRHNFNCSMNTFLSHPNCRNVFMADTYIGLFQNQQLSNSVLGIQVSFTRSGDSFFFSCKRGFLRNFSSLISQNLEDRLWDSRENRVHKLIESCVVFVSL